MSDLDPEALEAETRQLMAYHAGIRPRGFNSARDRQHLHVLIDQLLDRYAIAVALAALEDLGS